MSLTCYVLEEATQKISELKPLPMVKYGEQGAKMSPIKLYGKNFKVQVGACPLADPEDPEKKPNLEDPDLLTTNWGITAFVKKDKDEEKEDNSASNNSKLPPGASAAQAGEWNFPSSQNDDSTGAESSKEEKKLPSRRTMDIVLQPESANYKFIKRMDEWAKEKAIEKRKEWFNRDKLGHEAADMLYSSALKELDGQTPSLRAKTNVDYLKIAKCSKEYEVTPGKLENIKKDCNYTATLEVSGVWMIKDSKGGIKNYGLIWNLTDILVYEITASSEINIRLPKHFKMNMNSESNKRKREEEEEEEVRETKKSYFPGRHEDDVIPGGDVIQISASTDDF